MGLTHLRDFANVARTGSFTEGARLSHVSPPAISKAIKRLETEIGTDLFARSTRRVVLTEHVHDYVERRSGPHRAYVIRTMPHDRRRSSHDRVARLDLRPRAEVLTRVHALARVGTTVRAARLPRHEVDLRTCVARTCVLDRAVR